MLACGPYFDEAGMVASLVLLVLIKPLSYFAYIRAFRYRVCAAIPMSMKRSVSLTALRAGLGLALVGGGAWLIQASDLGGNEILQWGSLYLVRAFAWWIVGRVADLRGWRMLGWIIGGEAINVVFDFAILAGLATGVVPAIGAVVLIAIFVALLEWRGRRPELIARFSADPNCPVCQYNLTGNLSGICPECGTPIRLTPALQPALP